MPYRIRYSRDVWYSKVLTLGPFQRRTVYQTLKELPSDIYVHNMLTTLIESATHGWAYFNLGGTVPVFTVEKEG